MKGKAYANRKPESERPQGDSLYRIGEIVDISKKIYGTPIKKDTLYSWLSVLGIDPVYLSENAKHKFYDKNTVDNVLIKLFYENTIKEIRMKIAEIKRAVIENQDYDTNSVYVNYNGEDFYRCINYLNRIAVSKSGKVFSIFNQTLYKTYINPISGYETLILMLQKPERHTKTLYVHRLVAENFIENPLAKKEVNHIDGNRTNNNVSNLEWVTGSENLLHSYRVLNRKPCLDGINKPRELQKVITKEQFIFIKKHSDLSVLKLCSILNIPEFRVSVVRRIKNGKSYRGYNYLLEEENYGKEKR